jgi:hypothetical protein
MNCTPSARLELEFSDTSSEAAKEGTLAHEVCEAKVLNYFFPGKLTKRQLNAKLKKFKEHELWQSEMEWHTNTYLDYIKAEALKFEVSPSVNIEVRLDLTNYIPEGYGTADCVLIGSNRLEVIDFKYGKGVPVSAENNQQLLLYALGAYEKYKMICKFETVKVAIVQPRIADEASEFELSVTDLLRFGEEVKAKAALAYEGKGEYNPSESTCRFCRARATCRARADKNVELAFACVKPLDTLSYEEVGEYLKKGMGVAAWIKDLRDYALDACLAGHNVTGWKAVEGKSTRVWSNQLAAFTELKRAGLEDKDLYKYEPLTLAQIEKTFGEDVLQAAAAAYIIKPPGKPTLVEESDKREAMNNINNMFEGV